MTANQIECSDGGYSARVILDSQCLSTGSRVTTLVCRYPRFIHSELLTHRAFARNSASSRAIPFPKLLQQVIDDPVIPLRWGHDGGGMKQGEEVVDVLRPLCLKQWLNARDKAVVLAKALWEIEQTAQLSVNRALNGEDPSPLQGKEFIDLLAWTRREYKGTAAHKVHRSLPNRLVEPFMWMTCVITATDWKNFFRLRCHEDAEIHMQKIAYLMQSAHRRSTPQELKPGEWHLPFVTGVDRDQLEDELADDFEKRSSVDDLRCSGYITSRLAEVSTGRCARVSYLTHEGKRDWRKDQELWAKLRSGSGFGHWSPTEHPCRAEDWILDVEWEDTTAGVVAKDKKILPMSGPFRGFTQFRKLFAPSLENGDAS